MTLSDRFGLDGQVAVVTGGGSEHHIRVNGVAPGPIPTEVFLEFMNLEP